MQMDELLALRLTRQHLLSPTGAVSAASDLCGIQAQTCPTSCTPCASAQAAGRISRCLKPFRPRIAGLSCKKRRGFGPAAQRWTHSSVLLHIGCGNQPVRRPER